MAALAIAAAPLAISRPAAAQQVGVTIAVPDIAFGFSDGYWDREHRWHQWRDHREAMAWREKNAEHYYDRRHDRDKDEGWRDSDRWWSHR
jgi:uncharacterized protein YraI